MRSLADSRQVRKLSSLTARLYQPVDGASMAVVRAGFGLLMAWEIVVLWTSGWITGAYVRPSFFFTYYGFGFVRPWGGEGMYVHFLVAGLAALGIALGYCYRACAAVFAFSFAWIFLIDQALYLNHFYLITLLGFLWIALPAHRTWSLDARRRPRPGDGTVPRWALWLLRFQIGVPYFFGGIAKLNADWLRGEPMGMWLRKRSDFPVLGPWFEHQSAAIAFSYGGLLLDLFIVPCLLWRRTRRWAIGAAIAFHLLNSQLFDIGVFPWLMLAASTIFFDPAWPRRFRFFIAPAPVLAGAAESKMTPARGAWLAVVGAWVAWQSFFPLRHLVYPGNVSWTEEGHLFAWHMKLRAKVATAEVVVKDTSTGQSRPVNPYDLLNRRQALIMPKLPDMILLFAHHVADMEEAKTGRRPEVRARVMCSLNGRKPQLLIDPTVDLAAQERGLGAKEWVLSMTEVSP